MSEELKPEFIVGVILTEIVRQKPDREIHSWKVDKVVEAAKQICAHDMSEQVTQISKHNS